MNVANESSWDTRRRGERLKREDNDAKAQQRKCKGRIVKSMTLTG